MFSSFSTQMIRAGDRDVVYGARTSHAAIRIYIWQLSLQPQAPSRIRIERFYFSHRKRKQGRLRFGIGSTRCNCFTVIELFIVACCSVITLKIDGHCSGADKDNYISSVGHIRIAAPTKWENIQFSIGVATTAIRTYVHVFWASCCITHNKWILTSVSHSSTIARTVADRRPRRIRA